VAQFITLDKSSADYRRYLSGTFSKAERALPVPLQESSTRGQQATFQIVSASSVKPLTWAQKISQLYRYELLGFTFLPVGIVAQWAGERSWTNILLMLATLFFHGAVFAFNDYFDHMQGVDRMSEKRGTRLIQEGQLRAIDVFRFAWGYWFLAMLVGLPIIIQNPKVIYFLAAGLLIGTLGSTYSRFGIKAFAFNDLTVFVCLGPLLTTSVAYVVSQNVQASHLALGFGFGLMATMYVQARHLSSAMSDHRAGVQTLSVRLGFDKMKALLFAEGAVVFGIYAFLAGVQWSEPAFPKFFVTLVLVGISLFFVLRTVFEIRSPASSRAEALPGLITRAQLWITIFLFVFLA
jgi:1,4-dihydroxy-2-naphthoate polyprenyltransferase